ncbi:class I SAM-dependent methyltransferase [Streptomyces tendae]|uniref:class I SAM-dependent methyltransferase n=1 Tax=Streptomyces tendae TaxID=1932 RepID=UPI00369BDBD6
MIQQNLATWNVWAAAHGQDNYYDRVALVAGGSSLTIVEEDALRAAVGDVDGLDVLHIQCHIGFDSVTLARRGARVTGVDFSPVALDKAADLAAECHVDISWVCAESTALSGTLQGRFDLAYATLGILNWISDVDAWMRSVASCLRPGGKLLLVDRHPLRNMLNRADPPAFVFPYAFDGPREFVSTRSYAANTEQVTHVQFAHSLGEIVTAAVTAGLTVQRLDEHAESPVQLTVTDDHPDPDGRYRVRVMGQPVPFLYTLIAARP